MIKEPLLEQSDPKISDILLDPNRYNPNPERYQEIWQRIHALKDQYEMAD